MKNFPFHFFFIMKFWNGPGYHYILYVYTYRFAARAASQVSLGIGGLGLDARDSGLIPGGTALFIELSI